MKFYYSPGACSLASHIALVEGGIEHEAVKVDLAAHRTADGSDFYSISPRGYVPAIETDEFGLLTENPAVLTYLAERMHGLPSGEPLYRLLEWVGFVGTEIHGGYHPLFGRDTEDRQAKAMETLARKYRLTAELMDGRDWLVGDSPRSPTTISSSRCCGPASSASSCPTRWRRSASAISRGPRPRRR